MNVQEQYLWNRIQSSSPGELVVMLYDGLIRFSSQAAEILSMPNTPLAEAANAITRATNILTALNSSLKFEAAPDLCNRLSQLYEFFVNRLTRALEQRNAKLIHEIIPLMEDLRAGWSDAVGKLRLERRPAMMSAGA